MSAATPASEIRQPDDGVSVLSIAGPATRFIAWLIDLFFILLAIIACSQLVNVLDLMSFGLVIAITILPFFAVPILYGILFEAFWRGQTPGKRILRLRVVDAGGRRLGVHQIIIRNLLRAVDCLPYFYLVGGVVCFCTARSQRLGDLAANTVVVRTERAF